MMEPQTSNKPQLTALLPNDVLARIERLRINPRLNFTSKHRGEHLSGRGGNSIEFSDYRDYSPGDDIRFIDWNIFSRLRRPYLKLYRLEEEKHLVIIIDASKSMDFEGKLTMAKRLAAAFATSGLLGGERVSVYALNEADRRIPRNAAPSMGRASMRKIFRFIEGVESGGDIPLERGIDDVLKFHKGKGVAVLLSDFLTFGDLKRTMNALFSAGLETFAIQVLSPIELNPELTGDARFVDSETETTLDVSSIGELLSIYHEHRRDFEENLRRLCQQRSGRFALLDSRTRLEDALFNTLLRMGWFK